MTLKSAIAPPSRRPEGGHPQSLKRVESRSRRGHEKRSNPRTSQSTGWAATNDQSSDSPSQPSKLSNEDVIGNALKNGSGTWP